MNIEDLLSAPQLGEFVWHQQTQDPTVDDMSQRHLATLRSLAKEAKARAPKRPLRVLELGAYRHYSGHLLAEELGAEVWLSDISASALEFGRARAVSLGIQTLGQLCAADFHDLPFSDAYFDLVFIASAVHHTRRPERVLREMLRVLRPEGLLWLDNEPVARAACLYLFNSNRPESYSRYEQALAQHELLRMVSSPFHGTRPEEMFAMVENDRIPLDLYLHELQAAGTIEHLQLETNSTCQNLEKRLAAICEQHPQDAPARLTQALCEVVERARCADWVADALGLREPSLCEIHTLALRFADAHRITPGVPRGHALARLYGAALQAKVRRAGDQPTAHVNTVFKRQPQKVNDCWLDTQGPAGAAFMGMRAQFPDIYDAQHQLAVRECFAPLGWTLVTEASGQISLANLTSSAGLPLPQADAAILLMRVYTVPLADAPYTISIRQGHRLITQALVAQAESRLLRGLVYADGGEIVVEHLDARGRPQAIEWNLRVSVLQMLSLA